MKDHSLMLETMVRKFNQLQEERVHTYRIFEEGHKIYLNSGPSYDFPTFRQLVHDITQDFKRISEGIIAVEKALRTEGHDSAADLIADVQDNEKKKLELTAHLQLARQMIADSENGELEKSKEREIRCQLGQVVEEINENLRELRYEISDSQ